MNSVLLAIALLIAVPCIAQCQQLGSLLELRKQYEANVALAFSETNSQETAALKALEKSRVGSGDYESAKRVSKRLELLAQSAGPDASGRKTISLTPKAYLKKTGFGVASETDCLFFKKSSSDATWSVAGMPPGYYRAVLKYSCSGWTDASGYPISAEQAKWYKYTITVYGGRVGFSLVSALRGIDLPPVRISTTGGWDKQATISLGEFEVKNKTTAEFLLGAKSAESGGVLKVFQIDLVPIPTPAPVDSPEFVQKRDKYSTDVRARLTATHQKWMAALTKLEQEYITAGDEKALAIVKDEQAKTAKLLGVSTQTNGGGASNPSGTVQKPLKLMATDKSSVVYKGEVRLTKAEDALSRIRPVGARISFKITGKVPAGNYRVMARFRPGANSGGTFSVKCKDAVVKGSMIRRRTLFDDFVQPESQGTWTSAYADGVLAIPADATYLDFVVESLVHQEGALGDLQYLELTPATPRVDRNKGDTTQPEGERRGAQTPPRGEPPPDEPTVEGSMPSPEKGGDN